MLCWGNFVLRVWSSWSGLGTKKQPGTWLGFGKYPIWISWLCRFKRCWKLSRSLVNNIHLMKKENPVVAHLLKKMFKPDLEQWSLAWQLFLPRNGLKQSQRLVCRLLVSKVFMLWLLQSLNTMSLTLMSWNWSDFKTSTLFLSSKTIKRRPLHSGLLHKGILTDRETGSDVFVTLQTSETMESCWSAQRPAVLIIYFFEPSAVLDKDRQAEAGQHLCALNTKLLESERGASGCFTSVDRSVYRCKLFPVILCVSQPSRHLNSSGRVFVL